MKTRVSIIIPIYNVAQYIEECLQSVTAQSMTEGVECILVDDCGTDDSVIIVEQYIRDYQGDVEFRICHHDKNKGLSAARNTGIRAAKGEYVYFLDSDDTITPDCMAGFLRIIEEHPGVDLIQGLIDQDSAYMNQFETKNLPDYTDDRKYIKKALLDYDMLPVCAANKMVRRNLITANNLFFKEGIIHEDNYWSFFLAKHVKSLAVYPEKCYLYTVNPESITKAVNIEKETYSFQVIIEDFSANIDSFLRGEQKALIWYLLLQAIGNGYYHGEKEKNHLFQCLCRECRCYEKAFMQLWYALPDSSKMKRRLVNFLIRLFRM